MNILMVSDVYFPRVNGVSTSIQTFRRELTAVGDRVALVCPDYGRTTGDEVDVWRVQARPVPRDPEDRFMDRGRLDAAFAQLTSQPWDLVHVQTPFLAHYAGLAVARRLGVPCVATYHTLFEEYLHHYVPLLPRRFTAALARLFSRSQCNALDAIVVPSEPMRATLEKYGVAVPMRVLPTGIPLQAGTASNGARFRARHGIAPARPMLLFVGRVAGEKNIDFLLHMLAQLRPQVPDVLLVIAGEGPAAASLATLAQRLNLCDAVRFVGYLDRESDLQDCYRASDLFVFASRTETQGLVLLEAMASGLPVVALSVMGTRDILDPGEGCVVPPDDPRLFARCVARVLRDRDHREQLSREALAYARNWSAPARAQKLRAFYRDVLSGSVAAPNWSTSEPAAADTRSHANGATTASARH